MSVFVAESCIAYEGCDVIGVFSTLEAAKNACVAPADSWVVSEYEIDSTEYKTMHLKHWGTDWEQMKNCGAAN